MKSKHLKRTAKNVECFRTKLRESQECLRSMIEEIEQKFFNRIRTWNTKDAKKLYNDYSLYVLMEDLLQAVEKASQRL